MAVLPILAFLLYIILSISINKQKLGVVEAVTEVCGCRLNSTNQCHCLYHPAPAPLTLLIIIAASQTPT